MSCVPFLPFGLVGIGSPSGLLSTLPQQVQADRTLLVFATPKVERCDTEVLGCRSSMCAENDVEAIAHELLQKRQRLSDWRHRLQAGNDAIKQTTTTI